MKYKVIKDYQINVNAKIFVIPKNSIIHNSNITNFHYENPEHLDYLGRPICYNIKESILKNNPEYFELIEEKMTWEKLNKKTANDIFTSSQPVTNAMQTIQEHCILKDEIPLIDIVAKATTKTIIKAYMRDWFERNKELFARYDNYQTFYKALQGALNDL